MERTRLQVSRQNGNGNGNGDGDVTNTNTNTNSGSDGLEIKKLYLQSAMEMAYNILPCSSREVRVIKLVVIATAMAAARRNCNNSSISDDSQLVGWLIDLRNGYGSCDDGNIK